MGPFDEGDRHLLLAAGACGKPESRTGQKRVGMRLSGCAGREEHGAVGRGGATKRREAHGLRMCRCAEAESPRVDTRGDCNGPHLKAMTTGESRCRDREASAPGRERSEHIGITLGEAVLRHAIGPALRQIRREARDDQGRTVRIVLRLPGRRTVGAHSVMDIGSHSVDIAVEVG